MELLWKKEEEFKEMLENSLNCVKYDNLTIRELLDLGFNNNYLMLSNGKKWGKIELGYIDEEGNYSEDLTEEQLNVKVYMKEDFGYYSDEDIDEDGYHIAKVYCINSDDEKLFNKEEKE